MDTSDLRKRMQHVSHDGVAEAGEDDNPKQHVVDIIRAPKIFSRSSIVVLELKELAGPSSSTRKADVSESEEEQEVDRDACCLVNTIWLPLGRVFARCSLYTYLVLDNPRS